MRARPACRRALAVGLLLWLSTGVAWAKKKPDDDRVERRAANKARVEYYDGADPDAIRDYLLAIKRAWLIDDAKLISYEAYNFAAVVASLGEYAEARQWLCEARAEARRADLNEAEIWLLDAKCARQLGCVAEAAQMTDYAADAAALRHRHWRPEQKDDVAAEPQGLAEHLVRWGDECRERFHKSTAWLVPGHETPKEAARDVEQLQSSRAQVGLLRANLACDACDLATARAELNRVWTQVQRVKNRAVHAEAQRVDARILLISMQPRPAAERFDAEADLLRAAKVYREIPYAYFDAAECYEMAGELWPAADRMLRSARQLYACEAWLDALLVLEESLPLIELLGDYELCSRSEVIFVQLALAIEKETQRNSPAQRRAPPQGPSAYSPAPQAVPPAGPLAPQPPPPVGGAPAPGTPPGSRPSQPLPPPPVPPPAADARYFPRPGQPPLANAPAYAPASIPPTQMPTGNLPTVQAAAPARPGPRMPQVAAIRALRQQLSGGPAAAPGSRLAVRLNRPRPGQNPLNVAERLPPTVGIR